MADEQFTLGDALGAYDKAQQDRDFYLSMVQGGTTAASPIAAYLAGVAGVKMGQMRSEAQQLKDAEDATQRAIKRGETLRDNLFQIAKSARSGDIAPASAATLAGALVKEMGYNPREFDTENMILTYDKDGEQYELDLSESPMSKQQREYAKLALQREREDRLEREAQSRIKLNEQKLDNLAKGKASANSTQEEKAFIEKNKELFESVFNPSRQDRQLRRMSTEERLEKFGKTVLKKQLALENWLRGVATLDEDAQERLGAYTDFVEKELDKIKNPQGATISAPGSNTSATSRQGTKVF